MKLLIGGSPCTYWSLAQTKHRETAPRGVGWELFENYLIARTCFRPDWFLYENNKSMSRAIREEITRQLGVKPICINSALVSAQNRQRLYWTNIPGVQQPEDRHILLRDILETGEAWREKGYTLRANYFRTSAVQAMDVNHFPATMAAEPVRNLWRVSEATKQGYATILPGECADLAQPNSKTRRGRRMAEKANCLTTSCAFYEYCGTLDQPVYRVEGGLSSSGENGIPSSWWTGAISSAS